MPFEAPSARLIRRLLLFALLGVVLAVVTIHVANPSRGARLSMLKQHHAHLKMRVDRLRSANRRAARELRSLEEGVAGWREVARREHAMIVDGEVIYRFPTDE